MTVRTVNERQSVAKMPNVRHAAPRGARRGAPHGCFAASATSPLYTRSPCHAACHARAARRTPRRVRAFRVHPA